VPRKNVEEDVLLRPRRRSVAARKAEDDAERGLAMRILLHSPKDLLAGSLAFVAATAIVANAMFMQAGHHPSPMFGSGVTTRLSAPAPGPLPRPRPVDAETAGIGAAGARVNAVDASAHSAKPVASSHAAAGQGPRPPGPAASANSDPVADLINATRRVAAVQRTLTEYGYGQLKPTGTVGTDTQAAIRKFEQARRMPVTGQMSDRLVRELVAVTGRQID
jgi:hypothetical protein